ncbi:phage tail protein [Salmonella enterica]|uniref:phage tail protein n=1 Tax=Salmonella enterica TaxID=28901 RepID=UPI0009AC0EB5|nr:phage tail protein [Salmonella enterica]EDQ3650014.1 phage tail protein [Salmonella enterica subsp. enterica]EAM3588071.1 phage tail protein [Salmonella enterica]EAN1765027.1 phage tail protein [Salmonella enterica]EAN2308310.1 phage tail protein [Salmonella enterica]EAO5178928.1 phage tail protein [Salmonella enterica]
MAESQFYAILTDQGAALEATALATGIPVTLDKFVIGDGGGNAVTPDPTRTTLVNEVYRGTIQKAESQGNQVTFTLHVPPEAGGYTIREAGILTADGTLYSLSNSPDILKPTESNGAVISITFKYILAVSSTSTVNIIVYDDYLTPEAADKKYLTPDEADERYYKKNNNLSEIKEEGEEAQREAQLNIGIDLSKYDTSEEVDKQIEEAISEFSANINVAPKFGGDGAYSYVSTLFAIVNDGGTKRIESIEFGQLLPGGALNPASMTAGGPDGLALSGGGALYGIWRTCSAALPPTSLITPDTDAVAYLLANRVQIGTIDAFSNIRTQYRMTDPDNEIELVCDIAGVGTDLLFTASSDDPEEYGRQLYDNAVAGMYESAN